MMKDAVINSGLLSNHDRVLVAVSGGPDSVALLHVLSGLRKKFNLKLFAVHLNHMIRRGGSERDAAFVARLAGRLRVPLITETADVPRLAKDGRRSLEDAARRARYDFFARAAEEAGANKIALAHTMDDQAETVLMRLLRGSGLLGLSGIPARRRLGGAEVIRPFINVSKKDILRFLTRKNITFCKDPTNVRATYLRNKIRLKLIPFLERGFEPAAKRILADTGANVRVDYEYLADTAAIRFKKYARASGAQVCLDDKFLKEHLAVQRMVVREAIKAIKGDLTSVSYAHWANLNRLLREKRRWAVSMPGDIIVKRVPGRLIFARASGIPRNDLMTDNVTSLKVPGTTYIAGTTARIQADYIRPPARLKNKVLRNIEYFDPSRLNFPLTARFRRASDRILLMGMGRAKRLKRLFIDEKIPLEDRQKIPLIVSGGNIIWACGVRRSDHAKIKRSTKTALRLRFRER